MSYALFIFACLKQHAVYNKSVEDMNLEVDSCLVVSERICAVNAALENCQFFYFHFLYD